jgi:peptidoglycan/LPS O-acetylase OafA/YrhL
MKYADDVVYPAFFALNLLLVVVGTIASSTVLYYVVESPFMNWSTRLVEKWQANNAYSPENESSV